MIILGLGSNKSYNGFSPVELLSSAVKELSSLITIKKVSSVYETKPMYLESQENFFNAVLLGQGDSALSPHSLLEKIHKIEAKYGRNREKEVRFGPRSLDIDIEEFNLLQLNENDLILPHPRMSEREFVLIPLLEIYEKSADLINSEKIKKMLEKLPSQGVVKSEKAIQEKFIGGLYGTISTDKD